MSEIEVEAGEDPSPRRRRLPDWVAGNLLLLPTSVWFVFFLVIVIVFAFKRRTVRWLGDGMTGFGTFG